MKAIEHSELLREHFIANKITVMILATITHILLFCVMINCGVFTQNSEVRLQFQEFLSLNGHHLEQRPFPDVVQLALSQPVCSEVYRQALMQAQKRASRGQLYLDWVYASLTASHSNFHVVYQIENRLILIKCVFWLFRNKNNQDSLSLLVMHPHQGSVYYACFSKDGSKIASCGANKALRVNISLCPAVRSEIVCGIMWWPNLSFCSQQVFKTTSGEKLLELQAHDEDILCCAFSPDDRYIATCSSDRKVKVSVSVSVPALFLGQYLSVGQVCFRIFF